MLLDSALLFSDSQVVTASAASTNGIDLKTARNIGVGEPNYLVVTLMADMTDGGSDSTVTATLRTSATAAGSPLVLSGTINTLATLPVFPALSKAGTQRVIALPPASSDNPYLEYIDVYYTVANGNLTTGKFSAAITHDFDANQAYAAGYTVS
jgi:hypothetical protein